VTEIILHHFDSSPFAEKIRVALGIKGVSWASVQIPMVMPKPDLVALTGGYRKTPVMQIGADIYCDTQRIGHELEARCSGPSLFPSGTEGLCHSLASWSDLLLFRPGAALSMGTNLDLPEDILQDRFAFFDFLDRETLPDQLVELFAQFRANLQRLEDVLADGREFLLGESPSWADAASYAPVWMCRGNIRGASTLLENLPALQAWEQRVAAFGHGTRSEISAEDALAISRDSRPVGKSELSEDRWPQIQRDVPVAVSPDDYGADPVHGELVSLTQHEIAVRRADERAGQVVVYFPRVGYKVTER
jgi:glutathione S-transferase